jgi:hypothetical protein
VRASNQVKDLSLFRSADQDRTLVLQVDQEIENAILLGLGAAMCHRPDIGVRPAEALGFSDKLAC